eukprot:2681116-Rhodomonas_salina.1
MPLKVKRARQTAGAALFLVPGSLSGLINDPAAAQRPRAQSAKTLVISQIRRKKQVNAPPAPLETEDACPERERERERERAKTACSLLDVRLVCSDMTGAV